MAGSRDKLPVTTSFLRESGNNVHTSCPVTARRLARAQRSPPPEQPDLLCRRVSSPYSGWEGGPEGGCEGLAGGQGLGTACHHVPHRPVPAWRCLFTTGDVWAPCEGLRVSSKKIQRPPQLTLAASSPTTSSFQASYRHSVGSWNEFFKLSVQAYSSGCELPLEEGYSPSCHLLHPGHKMPTDCWSAAGYRVRLHRFIMWSGWSPKCPIQWQVSPGRLKSPGGLDGSAGRL